MVVTSNNMASVTARRSVASARALQADAEALQAAIADLVRVYQFRDRDRICCHDISVTQCYALETLVEQGPMRLSDLAARLFLDKSTTSRVVTALVKKRYVEHRDDPNDRRATELSPTKTGRALYGRITRDLIEQQKSLLSDLDPDVRGGVVDVIRRFARAADSRFRSGVSVGGQCAAGACGPGECR
jgi:DNA-binding MarR family transcriptional regulator